jgi:hypothetical protein
VTIGAVNVSPGSWIPTLQLTDIRTPLLKTSKPGRLIGVPTLTSTLVYVLLPFAEGWKRTRSLLSYLYFIMSRLQVRDPPAANTTICVEH